MGITDGGCARKKDGSIRICIDPRDLNRASEDLTILSDRSTMLPRACLMPQYFQLLMQGVVSGKLIQTMNLRCLQP